MKNIFKHDQRGDTIVEVMVVLAVLGLAIGISYATANRSLQAARVAQENAEATAILQSQIELLRYLAPNGTTVPATNIFQPGVAYCIDASNHVVTSPCLFDNLYQVDIQYDAPPSGGGPAPTDDTFTLHAGWLDVTGQGTDSVTLSYRVHKP